jgi:acyl transferase domain-containing protein/acyl carrier protein
MKEENFETGLEIAVIGMDGRFPGARNIDEFWENLKNGIEPVSFFSDEELEASGIEPGLLKNPEYVKAALTLEDIEYFDSTFFGYTPKEAEIMDPQLRFFHECAWKALEDAGYDPYSYRKPIGCYSGASGNFYWEALSYLAAGKASLGRFDSKLLQDKDYLSTRVAHKLNLRGPAVTVHTACSTSLVAIHMACQGLLSSDCAMALAGGVSLLQLNKGGYLYQEGMILSRDGHNRSFDVQANGTIFGDGVGVVVLKRLEDAIYDKDNIYAVIKGSYVNNDGLGRSAYTAPGIEGQAAVIRTAHQIAGVDPESITYLEAHGTGTSLGDPIEIEGLKLAFKTKKKQFCRFGSVKSNVGHLNIAAGVTGFIKTVMALKHRLIPPSLHFETPNPKIDFENSPFYVNKQLTVWQNDGSPLRAGVSSFGIGGTNAHVVLEEWRGEPVPVSSGPSKVDREYKLLLVSAGTESSLEQASGNLAGYLKQNPGVNFADVAYTLQVGRKHLEHRKMLVCPDTEEAIHLLSSPNTRKVRTFYTKEIDRPVIFMFPGLGSQYVNMGLELYRKEPLFREEMDRCFDILKGMTGYDLKEILYPSSGQNRFNKSNMSYKSSRSHINHPQISQLIVFIFEYSLAALLMKWGIQPRAMIGYSFGEYTAACLAGVFTLEDALTLIQARGKLVMELPEGLMVSVPLTVEEVMPFLNDQLSVSVDNGPSCIISGPPGAIQSFEKEMKEKRYMCVRLEYASRAIHSKMMEPILEKFEEILREILLNKPQILYISNVTGKWAAAQEVTHPAYWTRHLRETVQFAAGIEELVKMPGAIFVEIGPGRDLSALVQRYTEDNPDLQVLNMVRHPQKEISDVYYLLDKIGYLWLYGKKINWNEFYYREKFHRLSLPTYPFERQRFPIKADPLKIGAEMLKKSSLQGKKDISDWFYLPSWKPSFLSIDGYEENSNPTTWLVFIDECDVGARLVKHLEEDDQDIITVKKGIRYGKKNARTYTVNPKDSNDYKTLFKELNKLDIRPGKIVHLWGVIDHDKKGNRLEWMEKCQDLGYYSLIFLVRAIEYQGPDEKIQIITVTNNMQGIYGEHLLYPEKATLLGPVNVIPKEYQSIKCRSVDITGPGPGGRYEEKNIRQLLKELQSNSPDTIVVYHGGNRLVPTYEPVKLAKSTGKALRLKEKGVYMVTGGLGDIGLLQAEYLAGTVGARLILTGRSDFPAREQWEQWLHHHQNREDDVVGLKIKKLLEIEKLGGEVLVFSADVSHQERMEEVISRAEKRFGPINGVIHNALQIDGGVIHLITREKTENVFASKVRGTLVLDTIFKNHQLDFFILSSSTASIMMEIGHVAYGGASAFLDAFAQHNACFGNGVVMSINWTAWSEVGGALQLAKEHAKGLGLSESQVKIVGGLLSADGIEAFNRIMQLEPAMQIPQVVVYPHDLVAQVTLSKTFSPPKSIAGIESSREEFKRPKLASEYVAPRDDLEQTLVDIWSDFFGFEQIGIQDDFFELGGDSLKAIVMTSLIEKELDAKVSIATIFNKTTIEELAKYIEEKAKKSKFSPIRPIEKREYYKLSSAQKRLYILQQMDPGNKSYNRLNALILDGQLDTERLETTFRKLIERHESLRTSFEIIKEEPVQRIHAEIDFEIEYFDLAARNAVKEEDEAGAEQRYISDLLAYFLRPFDLVRAPLLRVGVIRTLRPLSSPGESSQRGNGSPGYRHILIYAVHHIIIDGTSMEILRKDFSTLYNGNQLTPLKIQYKDFSAWQNSEERKELLKEQEKYWLRTFSGELPVLQLPTDYGRPKIQSFEGNTVSFELNEEETAALRNIVKEADVTLYMALFAVFTLLISKLSGQQDIIVGAPTTGRAHADLEGIIGLFVNILAIRNFPTRDKTFKKLLKEIKTQMLEAFSNQEYQFDNLVDKLLKTRDPSRNPIFDVVFNLLNYSDFKDKAVSPMNKDKNEETVYNLNGDTAQFDINLLAVDCGEKILFNLEYCTKLFKSSTIERFIEYFKTIVSSSSLTIDQKLSDIKMISPQEQEAFLAITPFERN